MPLMSARRIGSLQSRLRRRCRQGELASGGSYSAARMRGKICCSRTMLLARSSPRRQNGNAPAVFTAARSWSCTAGFGFGFGFRFGLG